MKMISLQYDVVEKKLDKQNNVTKTIKLVSRKVGYLVFF